MRRSVKFALLTERDGVKLPSIFPFTQELPALVKPLQAAVLTVGDIEIALWTNSDRMNQIEFPRRRAVLAPLTKLFAGCVIFDNARITVTVRDEDVAALREGNICGAAKILSLIRYVSNG